jgi:glutamate dehydrogenase
MTDLRTGGSMAAANFFGAAEARAGRQLTSQAELSLSGRRGDLPQGFVSLLIGHAAPEDLLRYSPRELARLAESAWDHLQRRPPGAVKVRIDNPAADRDLTALAAISVLEIVNDDMPFLLDSVLAELAEQGVEIQLVAHPIFSVERRADGALLGLVGHGSRTGQVQRESFIHIHVTRIEDAERREAIVQAIEHVLREVRLCVHDWQPMLARTRAAVAELAARPPPLPAGEVAEAVEFLHWLVANNFTFLGVREYAIGANAGEVEPVFESGLGILRERDARVLRRGSGELVTMTPEIRAFLDEPKALIITKANMRSRVHRRVHMDYIGIKRFGENGKVTGEFRIVGLFTSTAYTRSARTIPYLRRKLDAVLARAGFAENSHSGKSLVNVLEGYPRDDLFQIDEASLYDFALAIMQLDERPRVRVLARRDRFNRFVSVLVYVPRDRYASQTRIAIGSFLALTYKGRVSAFYPSFTEGPLVRVHFIIGRNEGEIPNPSRAVLEEEVAAIVRTWADDLKDALALAHPAERARVLLARYREAFSDGYREVYSPAVAVGDIRVIENLSSDKPVDVDFYRRLGEPAASASLKVWSCGRPIPLSERVPVLENMGFNVVDERTHRIDPAGGEISEIWFHDMLLERSDGAAVDLGALGPRLEACFRAVLAGEAENDGFNALVLAAGLPWRDVTMIRTLARFLRQVRIPYSQDYLWTALRKHPDIATRIAALVHAKFDPRLDLALEARTERQAQIVAEIDEALQAVESLDDDLILRRFTNAMQAAVRTNFFQTDESGRTKPTIAIKFESRKVDGLPAPRPLYEIFVYSPRVEGVHLRFGKVARGGIRWSDRPQDFRTEVLGLVKAQQVKNAVIVPVGAKGGFIPKHLRPGMAREALQAEGVAAYRLFISSLLDITDNLSAEDVVPPRDVVRHDGEDPYLVVAADKGTATFSDIANALAIEHGFWLGDAFASGGSAGYDHKGMGITARGAWEAVKRHFREIDIDIGTTPFTVAGVGDMSGDVFGNGMLRERTIRLVAAFDHRDIFIDPDPDPERSFEERERLFALPRSSWQDYDKSLISAGGGVFSRAAKEIALSPQAQEMLGLESAKATPQQVMRAILRCRVDLLWFGGIGTYVRASAESDDSVGDRSNDAIRATGPELRCQVIGEGANLGMTQRGRIEAAMRGIRLNTDAIDNSAGVNTSDVEVNIKIALSEPLRTGTLALDDRNALLAEMTDEVAGLVLRNNYLQTLTLSLAERRGAEDVGFQQRLMQTLEARGELDRKLEFLPEDMEIAERRQHGAALTRPELAVLLAYAKLSLYDELLESSVPDDPYLARELGRYFPRRLSEQYPNLLQQHRLRREIIATQLANSMINRGGPSLIVRMADKTGASSERIAFAFAAVRNSYDMTALNTAVDALDGAVGGAVQLSLYAAIQDLLIDRLVWFLRHVDFSHGLGSLIDRYGRGIVAVSEALDGALSADARRARDARSAELETAGVPSALARRIADLPALAAAPDIILVTERSGRSIPEVTATYFAAGALFGLDRIRAPARAIQVTDYFDQLALDRALDSIAEAERRMTAEMVTNGVAGTAAVDAWVQPRAYEVERIRAAVDEITRSAPTISKLTVAASLVGDLVKQ